MSIYIKTLPRVVFKRGLPVQLIYFVTSRCNSSCAHCFLRGKLNDDRNILSLDEVKEMAPSVPALLSLSLTGGEPFLRDDLPQIADIFYKNNGFKNLAIISNGLKTNEIVSAVERILADCPNANVFIGLSFDGLEATHDTIRGVTGAFEMTKKTFFGIKALKNRYKNLSLGTSTTCTADNQLEIHKLYDFLLALKPDGIGINLARSGSWRHYIEGIDIQNYINFTHKRLADVKAGRLQHSNIWFNKLLYAKEKLQYEFIARTYSRRKYLAPCYAGRLIAIMKENGDIYPCEMFGRYMGNIRDFSYDLGRLWASKQADSLRRDIAQSRCFCTYECAMTSNILFNPRFIPYLIKEIIKR